MAAILTLKSNQVDKVSEVELLAMPNITFDGINENGFAINCNVASAVDLDFATPLSTNYGKPRIHAVSVVRYVLDHAKSAAHGVELLKNMDIYGGYGTWRGLPDSYASCLRSRTLRHTEGALRRGRKIS